MNDQATTTTPAREGRRFFHRNWTTRLGAPVLCEITRTRPDSYKGEPITVVTVQEVDGARRAAYRADRIPAFFWE